MNDSIIFVVRVRSYLSVLRVALSKHPHSVERREHADAGANDGQPDAVHVRQRLRLERRRRHLAILRMRAVHVRSRQRQVVAQQLVLRMHALINLLSRYQLEIHRY